MEALEIRGSWSGSHADALAAAQLKLQGQSMRDREQSSIQGWDTPEALLARWIRLHRLDYEVTGDKLTIRIRVKASASPKAKRVKAEDPQTLFEES